MFIIEALVQADQLYPALNVNDEEITKAALALSSHRDQNSDAGVPLYSFWNQVSVQDPSGTKTQYRASPPNIDVPLSEAETGVTMVSKWLRRVGLVKYADVLKTVVSIEKAFSQAFRIPPDSDDTGCNLALGRLLLTSQGYPNASQVWSSKNSRVAKVFDYFEKYAYRPNSGQYPANLIDPRTYLWARGFLQERKFKKDLALITTWMQSVDEITSQRFYRRMPFNLNNIDISVTVNALFGITQQLLFGKEETVRAFQESNMPYLYIDNVELVSWALREEVVERFPTHALLYYPPKYAFYWFVARLVNALQSAHLSMSVASLTFAQSELTESMEKYGVPAILKSVHCDAFDCYWDDFLGNGDTYKNKSKLNFEDRVFSTAMAVNALIDTYSITTNTGVKFRPELPGNVASVIYKAMNWLLWSAQSFPKQNAFFSGSIKTGNANPYYFPHNSFKWLNGTSAGKCSDYKNVTQLGLIELNSIAAGVEGVIEESEYSAMLHDFECFGKKPSDDMIKLDLNCKNCVFPYWSSPALTESMEMLALAKFKSVSTQLKQLHEQHQE